MLFRGRAAPSRLESAAKRSSATGLIRPDAVVSIELAQERDG